MLIRISKCKLHFLNTTSSQQVLARWKRMVEQDIYRVGVSPCQKHSKCCNVSGRRCSSHPKNCRAWAWLHYNIESFGKNKNMCDRFDGTGIHPPQCSLPPVFSQVQPQFALPFRFNFGGAITDHHDLVVNVRDLYLSKYLSI